MLLQFEDQETQFIFHECEQSQTLLSLNLGILYILYIEETNIHIPEYQGTVRPNESLIRLSLSIKYLFNIYIKNKIRFLTKKQRPWGII